MSVTRTYTVWCDHPECYDWEYATEGTQNRNLAIQDVVKRHGWAAKEGRHLCPKHIAPDD